MKLEKKERGVRETKKESAKHSKEEKNLSFQEDLRFRSNFYVSRDGGDIPTTM